MSYCTLEQLQATYGLQLLLELSDRGDTFPTEPDADLFARAIADADALIDGYCFGRYALPLDPLPAIVTDLSQRVAIYKAHARVASEKIRKDFEDAIKTLKEIAAGTVKLQASGVEQQGSGGGGVLTNTPERPFTHESMKGYI